MSIKLSELQADLANRNLPVTIQEKPCCGRQYGRQLIRNNFVYYIEVSLYYQLDDNQNPIHPNDRDVHFGFINVRRGDIHMESHPYIFDADGKKDQFLEHIEQLAAA